MTALVILLLSSNILLLTCLIVVLIDRNDLRATAEAYQLAFQDVVQHYVPRNDSKNCKSGK